VYDDRYVYINELVAKVKQNDGEALGELYEFYKPLFLCSMQRCLNKEPRLIPFREDIKSECFLVLKKLVDQYDSRLTYFSYFLSTRLDINLLRTSVDKFLDGDSESSEFIQESASYDPFNKVEIAISLNAAMEKLNPKQKEAINLYFFEQMEQEEAAEKLGITQGSFSKRLQRALISLREILGEDFIL